MAAEMIDLHDIFHEAVARTSDEERRRFLDEACGEDTHARARVEALLRAHSEAGGFFGGKSAGAAVTDISSPAEMAGAVIGPYKLLEQIGEGGMGLVFMAEQQHPVRRLVALKIIKPGMDTKQVIARFEAERQALAMMDHPNIAKVHDAGATETGRPYFVMELVRGLPVNEFCDQKRLTVRERLQLFVQVCQAVQHAHQKGIIHRDLKPTNVLVTMADTVAFPKLLDFGIAKALGQSLTDNTLHTGYSQLVGTPLYMSPEQAEMNLFGVDTRSDVYALGVLLYELLTGTTPFDKVTLAKAGLDEMRRIIREDEPETVSARIARTRTEQPRVDAGVNRRAHAATELDWIVMKALEKDRSRRYESASALAADIQRYLSDEPVLACPPTTMYRFQKLARKHKPAIFTAASIALCLLLGTTVSAWQAVRATSAEVQATEAAASEAQQRKRAEANEQKAVAQRDEVKALYEQLAAKEHQLQRTLYAADMKLAKVAWEDAAVHQMQMLLDQHRPKAGERDLRGFEWHYLNRLSHAELVTFKAHGGWVESAAFSPDGKRIASVGNTVNSGRVIVWDAHTGNEIFSIETNKGGYRAVVFSPEGARLASSDYYGELKAYVVRVWDAKTGQELLRLNGGGSGVAFSPDGKRLASAGNAMLVVWDSTTGKELYSLKKDGLGATGDVIFSPDGKRLVTTPGENKVRDAHTGQTLFSVEGYSAAFSPDGKRLATNSHDETVRIWDANSGQQLLSFKGHPSEIRRLTFSPDGKRLATGGEDRMVKVWNCETGEELVTFKGHASGITSVAFSPDGTRLASTSLDGTVKIWDVTTTPDSRLLAAANRRVSCLCFSPDGKRVAFGTNATSNDWRYAEGDGDVTILDSRTGEELLRCRGHNRFVNSVTFNTDGTRLASASSDKTVKVWDAQSGKEILTFKGHTRRVIRVAFSPDGKRLCSTTGDTEGESPVRERAAEVKVWDAISGHELFALQGHSTFANCVVFSPDGTRLASSSQDETKLWDSRTGNELLSLPGTVHDSGLAFSPDGKRLAGSCRARSSGAHAAALGLVRVWDVQTGDELLTLEGHSATVRSVEYSPDGKRLASASGTYFYSGEAKIWDAQTGQELLALKGGSNNHQVAFSPDGNRLASNAGGMLKIYDATPLPEEP